MNLFGRCATAVVCLGLAGPATAATPWSRFVPIRRIQADPDTDYALTEENGPWMIMATTFSGDGAHDQARELVLELRKRYRLPAYCYQKRFDYTKPVVGRGLDRYGEPLKMRFQRDDDVTEIAVVVGDYASVHDPEAQKVLKRIKTLEPEALKVSESKSTSQSLAALRTIQKKLLPEGSAGRKKGPMGHAFIVTNPLLPQDYYVPKGIDKLVVEMNRGVKYSLLDCPERYTVKVATFTGHIVIDQKVIKQVESGASMDSRLADAADKAHRLTMALREKEYEAYEFHDRYSSMVTVGSFKTSGSPRNDGKIEINPAIHKIMTTFGAETKVVPGQAPSVGKPKKLIGIAFDLQPMPVEVPRRSLSSDYARHGG